MTNILIALLSSVSVSFIIFYIVLSRKNINISKKYNKLLIDFAVIQEYVDILKSQQSENISDDLVDKENFIKFLSDSRDWAYEYIEDVQSGLSKFVDSVNADISYFDEYGDVLSVERPDYAAMKNISKAYKELKKLLPVEEKQ